MSELSGYWTRKAIGRRVALRGLGAGGLGIAALSFVGCGSGSKRPAQTGGTTPVTDSSQGKPGGTLKLITSSFSATDALLSGFYNKGGFVNSSLLGHKWGQESVDTFDFSLEPDLAQALPEQPDDLTYVYKVRPGVKFHNGRVVTSEDVKYSFDRFATNDRSFVRAAYQVWYDRMETPDAQTVVLKTKFPYGDTLAATGGNQSGYILAKEHQEGSQASTTMMGSGPYVFVSETAPISTTFRRNPDYYLKPFPYFDSIEVYGNSDEVKRNADFVARNVHMPWILLPQQRDEIKALRPDAKVQNYEQQGSTLFMRTDKPPFNDKRVRQALSMGFDRKVIRDGIMKGEGRDDQFFSVAYKSIYGSSEVKDLGDAAKYWQLNPAEAKKLLAAAGYDKPVEAAWNFYGATGQWVTDLVTLTTAQWRDQGIANIKPNDQLSAVYSNTQLGLYDGMGMVTMTVNNVVEPSLIIRNIFYVGPNGDHVNGNLSWVNNSELSALGEKQLRTLKQEDRKQVYRAMQAIIAEEQYHVSFSTRSDSWIWDSSLRNVRMSTQLGSRRYAMRWWSDSA